MPSVLAIVLCGTSECDATSRCRRLCDSYDLRSLTNWVPAIQAIYHKVAVCYDDPLVIKYQVWEIFREVESEPMVK